MSDMPAKDIEKAITHPIEQKRHSANSVNTWTKPESKYPACHSRHSHQDTCPTAGKECLKCGGKEHFTGSSLHPTRGKQCSKCGKTIHFASKCRSSGSMPTSHGISGYKFKGKGRGKDHIHTVDAEEDKNCDYGWIVHQVAIVNPCPTFNMCRKGISLLADSVPSVNLLSKLEYEQVPEKPTSDPHNCKVYALCNGARLRIRPVGWWRALSGL